MMNNTLDVTWEKRLIHGIEYEYRDAGTHHILRRYNKEHKMYVTSKLPKQDDPKQYDIIEDSIISTMKNYMNRQ